MKGPRKLITLITDFGVKDSYVAEMKGVILASDHFGNLITNIHEKDYLQFKRRGRGKAVWIKSGKHTIKKLSKRYADVEKGPMVLFGSASLLEFSVRNDNASKTLSLEPGNRVELIYGRN